jgi:hypothetical protein
MRDCSEITVSEARPTHHDYKLIFRLLLESGKIGHHAYTFRYNPEIDRHLLLFIELTDVSRSVVVRMSAEQGDRKSYDAVELFMGIKSDLSEREWGPRAGYKRSLFSSDWDNFDGFWPFGFTLIQPPLSALASIGSGDFMYTLHKPPAPQILSLRIYKHRFRAVRIYKDLIARDVLSEELFGAEDGDDY